MEDTQFYKESFAILGAGGLARELESWISQTPSFNSNYKLTGFLDDNKNALDDYDNDYDVIGDTSSETLRSFENILIGIASPDVKESMFNRLEALSVNILQFLYRSAIVGNNNRIGKGLVMCPNSLITCNVTIGDGLFVNVGSQIGHDVKIGNYVSIMANVDIGGAAEIGDNVFIGSNAVILPGVTIPSGTRIGAGSVVMRNIKQSGTYFGNPAKKIF